MRPGKPQSIVDRRDAAGTTTDRLALVVGADSRIGSALLQALETRGQGAIGTTRRRGNVSPRRLLLDLSEDIEHFEIPQEVESVFLVAAITGLERCETERMSWTVNVQNITRLAARLFHRGCHVTFLSTNAVFGGIHLNCNEGDPTTPTGAYACQKAEAERRMWTEAEHMSAADRLTIIRLTKTLASDTPPLPDWFEQLSRNKPIRPFTDLVMSPISLAFATRSLIRINDLRLSGVLHLSGERDVSYAEFAEKLVSALHLSRTQVVPTTSLDAGVRIPHRLSYGGLGMTRTVRLAEIHPQPLAEVIAEVASEYRGLGDAASP